MDVERSKLLLEEEAHPILGAGFEVYREKGNGFVAPVYPECLELELARQAIEFPFSCDPYYYYKKKPFIFAKVLAAIQSVDD